MSLHFADLSRVCQELGAIPQGTRDWENQWTPASIRANPPTSDQFHLTARQDDPTSSRTDRFYEPSAQNS
jgi:hypothetical protein